MKNILSYFWPVELLLGLLTERRCDIGTVRLTVVDVMHMDDCCLCGPSVMHFKKHVFFMNPYVPTTYVCVSGTACTSLVLPEGCEHHYGCNEGDERGGVAHRVDLSERREVTRLQRERKL